MDIYDPSSMTLGSIGFMALWVLLTVPGIVLVAGIFMWIRRRR